MPEAAEICLIYATFPDMASARAAVQTLLAQRLVACCNIFPGMESHFIWEGVAQTASEVAMLCKTTVSAAPAAMARIAAQHPYENPAILQLPVTAGAADFVVWVARATAN